MKSHRSDGRQEAEAPVTCILASSRCAGDGDCRTLPHDLVPHGVSWWRTCPRFPWSPVADAAWHLAKEAAVSAWVSARHLPALWAVRHIAALDREAHWRTRQRR